MVESKSLKLYLFSFRNHGDFHEDCVNIIMKDLIRLMDRSTLRSGVNSRRAAVSRSTVLQLRQARHPLGGGCIRASHPPRSVPGEGGQPMSEKAMVLCSGGVDSTTCLALAIEKHGKENVCALSIYYGQKHVKEIQAAKAVLEYYGIEARLST